MDPIRRTMQVFARAGTLFIALLISVAAAMGKSSAPAGVENDCSYWNPVTIRIPLWRKLQAYFEVQPRFQKNHESTFAENIIRTGVGYEFNKKWSLFGGYYYSSHFDPEYAPEHRLWQQLTYSHKFDKLTLQTRFRCEESWRDTYEGASIRIRDQIRLTHPIGRGDWYAICSEEPFYNVNSINDGPTAGFTQNRVFVGVGRKINRYTRLEVGYLNQYRNSRSKKPDTMNHVLVAQLNLDFTQSKPKKESKLAEAKPANKLIEDKLTLDTKRVAFVPQIYLPNPISPAQIFSAEHALKSNPVDQSLQPIQLVTSSRYTQL